MIGNSSSRNTKLRLIAVPLLLCIVVVLLRLFVLFVYQMPQRELSESWWQRVSFMQKVGTPQRGARALVDISSSTASFSIPCYIVGVPKDTIRVHQGRLYVNRRALPSFRVDTTLSLYYTLRDTEYCSVTYLTEPNDNLHLMFSIQRRQIIGFSNPH